MQDKNKLLILLGIAVGLVLLFLFIDAGSNLDYILPRRGRKIAAMIITGTAIAYSSVIFQTISFNRILTPSIMGFDSVYLFIQTLIVFLYGSGNFLIMDQNWNFFLSTAILILFTVLVYKLVFRRDGEVFFFMLVGIVLGTLFRSLSTFMQMLVDPNEFTVIQDSMFASFNNVKIQLLHVAALGVGVTLLIGSRILKYLDVILLGREHAINLGVDYTRTVRASLAIVTILVAVSTSLVGPITFLGILVTNLAYQIIRSNKHRVIIPAAALISVIALLGGQLLIERVFYFNITLSVVINFVGGIYFIYLLFRESTKC